MRRAALPLVLATACAPPERTPPATTATTAVPRAEAWRGDWKGVAGTYLRVERTRSGYAVTIADLDGARTFDASAAGDRLKFLRDGKTETVRATDGEGTGMKWLADREDCLVVTAGSEGFCR